MTNKLTVKIYKIIDPSDGYVFYVGQTSGLLLSRLKAHSMETSVTRHGRPMAKFIKHLKEKGINPIIEEIDRCRPEVRFQVESNWIKHYVDLGFNLFNTCYNEKALKLRAA